MPTGMKISMKDVITALCLALLVASVGGKSLEVKTNSGVVRGQRVITEDGKKLNIFLGIPYAEPTSGTNRFAPPKEVEPWPGILDASNISGPCYQVVPRVTKILPWMSENQETEDCLKLNIWVPKRRPRNSTVMVWIYGGGFVHGSSDLPMYDGTTLATHENVIVVSLNYRLSFYGFLYLKHPDAPGNVGLMDQAAGLKWIKDNIEFFGGDPERITIFGESAGGASVGYQLLVPSSSELFRNAILQSGTANANWASLESDDAFKYSLQLAKHIGCPHKEDRQEEIVRCLQKFSADELRDLSLKVEDEFGKLLFRPVIDGEFLTSSPSELLKEGEFCRQKNILLGFTEDDGGLILKHRVPTLDVGEGAVFTEDQFRDIIKNITFIYKQISPLETEVVKSIYTNLDANDDQFSVRHQLVRYATDRLFGCPALSFADYVAERGNNVYLYRFDHVPESREGNLPIPTWMGSTHTDELQFVFGQTIRQDPAASTEEVRLAKRLMRYWANFARNDDPNDEYLPIWPKYSNQEKLRIHIDTKSTTINKTDRLRECKFWEHTFPKINVLAKNEL